MQDPGRRPDGVWPRDRPIRWRGVAGNLAWFVRGTAAGLLQVALAVPILSIEPGWVNTVLALIWAGLTLFAAWSWVLGRWRIVLAPIVTLVALALAPVA
jgi:hypothetical protein